MDAKRFDRLTRMFAGGRLSRRSVLRQASASVAGIGGGAAGSRTVRAQDATPVASPNADAALPRHLGLPPGERTHFLFVQTFTNGAWAPKPGAEGFYTLTLTGGSAQTVYFSDRPERVVGTVPTAQFLEGLGFSPDNPPNAALVAQTDKGEDVLVIELFNPVFDEAGGPDGEPTLTYDARVLENYQEEGLQFLADRQGDVAMPASFDAASLFIDDCADATFYCYHDDGTLVGQVAAGCCYSFPYCELCRDYSNVCNEQIGACSGNRCRTDGTEDGYCWTP